MQLSLYFQELQIIKILEKDIDFLGFTYEAGADSFIYFVGSLNFLNTYQRIFETFWQ